MGRIFPFAIALVLIGVSTYYEGLWMKRWSKEASSELKQLTGLYEKIPMQIGDWIGTDTSSNQRVLDRAGAHASISRRYRNAKSGDAVSVFVVCGYSRDIAVHTPDACYVAAGFKMSNEPKKRTIVVDGGDEVQMFTSKFKREAGESILNQRILWAWNDGGLWEAHDNPRFEFGGHAAINKIYLINDVSLTPNQRFRDSPAVEFGKIFLPLVAQILYPSDEAPTSDDAPTPDEAPKETETVLR